MKRTIQLICLALSAALLLSVSAIAATPTAIGAKEAIPAATLTPTNAAFDTVKDIKIQEKKEHYRIDIVYPKTGVAAFDRMIKEEVYDQIEDFKEDVAQVSPALWKQMSAGYGLIISYSLSSSANTLSARLNISLDTGGAHPNTAIKTIVFDKNTGKELELEDVFTRGTKYVQEISKLTTAELSKTLGDAFFPEGTRADEDNFEAFMLGEKGITFLFGPYQVAPYSEGIQSVTIAYTKLKGFLQITP